MLGLLTLFYSSTALRSLRFIAEIKLTLIEKWHECQGGPGGFSKVRVDGCLDAEVVFSPQNAENSPNSTPFLHQVVDLFFGVSKYRVASTSKTLESTQGYSLAFVEQEPSIYPGTLASTIWLYLSLIIGSSNRIFCRGHEYSYVQSLQYSNNMQVAKSQRTWDAPYCCMTLRNFQLANLSGGQKARTSLAELFILISIF